MTNAMQTLSPVLHQIDVNVVGPEEASLGVAELWSGDRLIGFTLMEDGDLPCGSGPVPTALCWKRTPSPKPSRRPTASSLYTPADRGVRNSLETILGHPPRSLSEFLADHHGAFN
jgi:hypothetical protein